MTHFNHLMRNSRRLFEQISTQALVLSQTNYFPRLPFLDQNKIECLRAQGSVGVESTKMLGHFDDQADECSCFVLKKLKLLLRPILGVKTKP